MGVRLHELSLGLAVAGEADTVLAGLGHAAVVGAVWVVAGDTGAVGERPVDHLLLGLLLGLGVTGGAHRRGLGVDEPLVLGRMWFVAGEAPTGGGERLVRHRHLLGLG